MHGHKKNSSKTFEYCGSDVWPSILNCVHAIKSRVDTRIILFLMSLDASVQDFSWLFLFEVGYSNGPFIRLSV